MMKDRKRQEKLPQSLSGHHREESLFKALLKALKMFYLLGFGIVMIGVIAYFLQKSIQ